MNLIARINRLKQKRDAIILAHNYQIPEVQDIADYVGDSLELSQIAARIEKKVIVFCGVNFMAESAKILSPEKRVLLPEKLAGCPLADMITVEQLRKLKADNPGAKVVAYINTKAEVKAEADICCTSSNAIKVVNSVDSSKVIFIPDKNLGDYVSKFTNKQIIIYQGYCKTHNFINVDEVINAKKNHSKALFFAHPECPPDVLRLADKVASTSGIIKAVKETDNDEFLIGTEMGILHRLKKENPEKKFYIVSPSLFCYNMKLTNLESILNSLENMQYEITLSDTVIKNAKNSLAKMIALLCRATPFIMQNAKLNWHYIAMLKSLCRNLLMRTTENTENTENSYHFSKITDKIIKCAIEVHKILSPGFLENIYENALIYELESKE